MLSVGPISKLFLSVALASLVVLGVSWAPTVVVAQVSGSVAISRVVSSQQEGFMEGVVANARRAGEVQFPPNRVELGNYALTIRAVGYEAHPEAVIISGSYPIVRGGS